jgi:hypothetical protein
METSELECGHGSQGKGCIKSTCMVHCKYNEWLQEQEDVIKELEKKKIEE